MQYVEVFVASNSYHGTEGLTYSSTESLLPGMIVLVPLRSKLVSAVVIREVTQPAFTAKAVVAVQVTTPLPDATLQLMRWLGSYFPAPSGTIVGQFIPSNLLKKSQAIPPPLYTPEKASLPPLTQAQSTIVSGLSEGRARTALIHGVTGSGKTRIYAEKAREVLAEGKNVIILTPEIGLTTQTAASFMQLGAPVIIFHSNLTVSERRTLWLQILHCTTPVIVVGPRSALFVPLDTIGLIVVDEAHDAAYKQDQAPRYHALRVAAKLAELHHSQLLLGTATPLVSEYYFLEKKRVPIFRLTETARKSTQEPHLHIVNLADRTQFSKSNYLSDTLLQEIEAALTAQRQSLVFLNRRGTARVVICQNGDWQALCPNCDTPLTYHGDLHSMRCHTCGYKEKPPTHCPICQSAEIVFRSMGTKALTAELRRLFPEATIQRFDTDNTKDEQLERNFATLQAGKVDIIVGTQMLVKGLDLPKLQVVGVVAADTSLYFPDYTAEELTYQLITQVIGRVGRGHGQSSVIIQTNNPNGRALQSAVKKDWQDFYHAQLKDRALHHFPPFYHILRLTVRRKQQSTAMRAATQVKQMLQAAPIAIEITGPSPALHERQGPYFMWQLIVRAKRRSELLRVIDVLPANWNHDIDPLNLL